MSTLHSTTFCSGFWRISGNTKRTLSHYLATLPGTFRRVAGGKVIFFYDGDGVLDYVAQCAKHFRVELHPIRIPIEALPAYPLADRLVEGCARADVEDLRSYPVSWREKGLLHHERDFLASGPEAYGRILSIWMSKIALVADTAIQVDPFGSDMFAWIDASVARFNARRENWDFGRLDLQGDQLMHYANRMRYKGEVLPINASCLIGSRVCWGQIHAGFDAVLAKHVDDAYPHDEETILGLLYRSDPTGFRCLGENRVGQRDRWLKRPHSLVRRYDAWRIGRRLGNG